jgi:hypothetical protein
MTAMKFSIELDIGPSFLPVPRRLNFGSLRV